MFKKAKGVPFAHEWDFFYFVDLQGILDYDIETAGKCTSSS